MYGLKREIREFGAYFGLGGVCSLFGEERGEDSIDYSKGLGGLLEK